MWFTFSRQSRIWSFHVVLQRTAKICTKNYNVRAQLLFCLLNLLFSDVAATAAVVAFYIYIYIILGWQSPYGYRANISNIITFLTSLTPHLIRSFSQVYFYSVDFDFILCVFFLTYNFPEILRKRKGHLKCSFNLFRLFTMLSLKSTEKSIKIRTKQIMFGKKNDTSKVTHQAGAQLSAAPAAWSD